MQSRSWSAGGGARRGQRQRPLPAQQTPGTPVRKTLPPCAAPCLTCRSSSFSRRSCSSAASSSPSCSSSGSRVAGRGSAVARGEQGPGPPQFPWDGVEALLPAQCLHALLGEAPSLCPRPTVAWGLACTAMLLQVDARLAGRTLRATGPARRARQAGRHRQGRQGRGWVDALHGHVHMDMPFRRSG